MKREARATASEAEVQSDGICERDLQLSIISLSNFDFTFHRTYSYNRINFPPISMRRPHINPATINNNGSNTAILHRSSTTPPHFRF
jgi:hypothetical protein